MCQALHIPLHHLLYAYNYVVYIKVLVYAARNQLLFEKYQTRQNTMPIYANKLLFIFALFKNSLFLYESKMWVYRPDSRYYCLFILWHEMNTFHELSTHCVSSNLVPPLSCAPYKTFKTTQMESCLHINWCKQWCQTE